VKPLRAAIPTFEFGSADIAAAAGQGRLLSMEIEFSLACNYRCPYCYAAGALATAGEMTPGEIRSAITQARLLGARRIVILGGEPLLYPLWREMVRFIAAQGLEVELFTNGSLLDREAAALLFGHGVRVVLKMNTFDAQLQDRLTGTVGAAARIRTALKHLQAAGYPSEDYRLAVASIICRQNLRELPRLWCWLRDRRILPYFEIITPQARALQNDWLAVAPAELEKLFRRLARIDRRRYGQSWDPQPPLVGNRCLRHQFSCLVTASGEVMPCVGVTIPLGNLRHTPLAEILAGSPVLGALRRYRETITGPCSRCEKHAVCYGCRGAAFQLTGDYLASDPLCWRIAAQAGADKGIDP
jgi:radical SAM protein with 4Fe4S-binding SPASM domain